MQVTLRGSPLPLESTVDVSELMSKQGRDSSEQRITDKGRVLSSKMATSTKTANTVIKPNSDPTTKELSATISVTKTKSKKALATASTIKHDKQLPVEVEDNYDDDEDNDNNDDEDNESNQDRSQSKKKRRKRGGGKVKMSS